MRAWLTSGVLAMLPAVAAAAPWYWGVGPQVGTRVLPHPYPASWPAGVADDPGRLEPSTWSVSLGLAGAVWFTEHHRLRTGLTVDLGDRYRDLSLLGTYGYALDLGAVDVVLGGGLGVGALWFGATDGTRLRVSHLPVRAEAALVAKDRGVRAYELALHGTWRVPTATVLRREGGRSSEGGFGPWLTLGVEVTLYFGDFLRERPHPRHQRGTGPSEERPE